MLLYTRVFVTVLDSSIAEDFTLRHVFEDLFKLCDWKTGVVDMTRQAISRRLNIPINLLNECIDKLESPDPASRDPEHQGRRLKRIDEHRNWGWVILNWEKYDAIRNRADIALRVAKHRAEKKRESDGTGGIVPAHAAGAPGPAEPPPTNRTRANNRAKSQADVIEAGRMLGMPELLAIKFWNHYEGTARDGVWVTGEQGEKPVGSWRNLLAKWKAENDQQLEQERTAPKTGGRSKKEADREPGPYPKMNVESFNANGAAAAPGPEVKT